jgi:hypothetical protein
LYVEYQPTQHSQNAQVLLNNLVYSGTLAHYIHQPQNLSNLVNQYVHGHAWALLVYQYDNGKLIPFFKIERGQLKSGSFAQAIFYVLLQNGTVKAFYAYFSYS